MKRRMRGQRLERKKLMIAEDCGSRDKSEHHKVYDYLKYASGLLRFGIA